MRILGFNFSRQGVTLPFSSIRIPISLVVMLIQFVSSARANSFPEKGDFHDQVGFVRSLPIACSAETSSQLHNLIGATNPFAHIATLPPDVKANVHRHEFDSSYGVVMRRTVSSGGTRMVSDSEQVLIGGVGDGSEQVTFTFNRNPDGVLRIASRERVPIDVHARGLEQQNVGLVASLENEHEHCFGTNAPR